MLNNINRKIKIPENFPMQISGSSIWTGAEMESDQSWKVEWFQNRLIYYPTVTRGQLGDYVFERAFVEK
jgi:hypothetical protein